MSDGKTKEDYIVEFITKFAQYEIQMEPFKEAKRDLRKSYRDNNYLDTDEMRQAVRAYRAIQNDVDIEDFKNVHELLKKTVGKI